MLKLFKNFTKKDLLVILICVVAMIFQVWIELRLPEYMSEIIRLIQTEGSTMKEIFRSGGLMMACAFGSAISTVFIGYFASGLSANFSMNLRGRLFKKVQGFVYLVVIKIK